jgi:hypothetical protein
LDLRAVHALQLYGVGEELAAHGLHTQTHTHTHTRALEWNLSRT